MKKTIDRATVAAEVRKHIGILERTAKTVCRGQDSYSAGAAAAFRSSVESLQTLLEFVEGRGQA